MGNIVSVSRDGKQKKAYTYDALNRIISEKDIDNEQEICYTYDKNIPILSRIASKSETAEVFTHDWDSRWYINLLTIIFGFFGM